MLNIYSGKKEGRKGRGKKGKRRKERGRAKSTTGQDGYLCRKYSSAKQRESKKPVEPSSIFRIPELTDH